MLTLAEPSSCLWMAICSLQPLRPDDYVDHLTAAFKACHQVVGAFTNEHSQAGPTLFKTSDLLLVLTRSHELPHKFASKWTGPYCEVRVPNWFQLVY